MAALSDLVTWERQQGTHDPSLIMSIATPHLED